MNRTLIPILAATLLAGRISLAEEPLHWSKRDVDVTHAGSVRFHGPFGRESVEITADLPAKHNFIRVSFDLLIIHAWDGNWVLGQDGLPVAMGPDSIRLGLVGGPTLLYTTFSNVPYVAESVYQNFPSPLPGDAMPAQAGASETDTHGYLFPHAPSNPVIKQDATYRIEFIVPHRDAHAVVQLEGINLQELLNESWGVAGLKFEIVPDDQLKPPDAEQVAALFDVVLRPDAQKPMQAFGKLICGMGTTVTWLRANVTPVPIDADKAKALVKALSLDDRVDQTRSEAMQELLKLGPQAEVFLRDERAVATKEGRCRIDQLLQSIVVTPIQEESTRRVMLATRVLEIIGTPDALDLRRKLVSR